MFGEVFGKNRMSIRVVYYFAIWHICVGDNPFHRFLGYAGSPSLNEDLNTHPRGLTFGMVTFQGLC